MLQILTAYVCIWLLIISGCIQQLNRLSECSSACNHCPNGFRLVDPRPKLNCSRRRQHTTPLRLTFPTHELVLRLLYIINHFPRDESPYSDPSQSHCNRPYMVGAWHLSLGGCSTPSGVHGRVDYSFRRLLSRGLSLSLVRDVYPGGGNSLVTEGGS